LKFLIHATQYLPNLSNMVRTAEFYGLDTLYIYDANNLLKEPVSKKERAERKHMGRVWTAGALDHITIEVVNNDVEFIASHNGRAIATVLSDTAKELNSFEFQDTDLVIFGSEKQGLPEHVITQCVSHITIPSKGWSESLNVSVFFGIVLNKCLS